MTINTYETIEMDMTFSERISIIDTLEILEKIQELGSCMLVSRETGECFNTNDLDRVRGILTGLKDSCA